MQDKCLVFNVVNEPCSGGVYMYLIPYSTLCISCVSCNLQLLHVLRAINLIEVRTCCFKVCYMRLSTNNLNNVAVASIHLISSHACLFQLLIGFRTLTDSDMVVMFIFLRRKQLGHGAVLTARTSHVLSMCTVVIAVVGHAGSLL